jgi:hypothetical protein
MRIARVIEMTVRASIGHEERLQAFCAKLEEP